MPNAIAIGKGMGNLIKVDDAAKARSTFRSYLRLLVEIDMHAPLKPGFLFHRGNGESAWISLKYERLDKYCTNCGRNGHKNINCRAPQEECLPGNYEISLKVNNFSNLSPTAARAWGSNSSPPPCLNPPQLKIDPKRWCSLSTSLTLPTKLSLSIT